VTHKDHDSGHGFGPDECTFEMKLSSSPREITKVEKFLMDANGKLHLDDGTMYRLLVAVTEAVNNAILHGNESDPSKFVVVCINANRTMVMIRVEDEGPGFDASDIPNPLDQENLLKEHGRGVFLIQSLVDKVEFSKTDSGSAITMTVDLNLLR